MRSDPAVVALYLRAREAIRAGWHSGLADAVALLEDAHARAPEDVHVLAALATARGRHAFLAGERAAAEGAATARRAIALRPDLPEAWFALATSLLNLPDPPQAARAAFEALRRAPGLAEAQALLGSLLLDAGRREEAHRRLEAAFAVDPARGRWDLSRSWAYRGDWSRVDALLEPPPETTSDRYMRAVLRSRHAVWRTDGTPPPPDDLPDAEPADARADLPRTLVAVFGRVHATRRLDPADRARIEDPPPWAGRRMAIVHFQLVAEVACAAGEHALARSSIARSIASGLLDVTWMDHCPPLAPLREGPGWAALRAPVAARAADVLAAVGG